MHGQEKSCEEGPDQRFKAARSEKVIGASDDADPPVALIRAPPPRSGRVSEAIQDASRPILSVEMQRSFKSEVLEGAVRMLRLNRSARLKWGSLLETLMTASPKWRCAAASLATSLVRQETKSALSIAMLDNLGAELIAVEREPQRVDRAQRSSQRILVEAVAVGRAGQNEGLDVPGKGLDLEVGN